MDTNAPAPKPDMLEQLKRTLERYSNGDDLAKRFANAERDSTLVLASAVAAVVAELRDIHNVLHEINQHMAVSVYGADALRVAEDAPDPNQCPKCLGEGVVLDEGRNVQRCEWCHGKGRVWS